jgi:phosphatidylserine/phosphatidylglycerophosphate/cardiolipin synthase-like enzyme
LPETSKLLASLKTLVFAATIVLNIPITPEQLRTMSILLPDHALQPRPRTSSVVAALMEKYTTALAAEGLALSEHNQALVTDFLTTLVACDSLGETILPSDQLLTTSTPRSVHVGTGLTVTKSIAAAISTAQHSVLFCTCFWAESRSREVLADALRDLSRRAEEQGRKVVVRIGYSSSSAAQKLFHTSSPKGKLHLPSTWTTLGLPGPEELRGLHLRVKSIFFLPFSVLHSKFCIIDRLLFLPSANISWETWLEQCTLFTGGIVDVFTSFWRRIWDDDDEPAFPSPTEERSRYPTLFLPHPHHRNPSFRPSLSMSSCLPTSPPPPPPATPQNTFLIHALTRATHSIYLQTPNLTSQPLLRALEAALARGVNIEIVTCRRMMVAEQLFTTAASASTEGCVKTLIRYDERLRQGAGYVSTRAGRRPPGLLAVWYYTGAGPRPDSEFPSSAVQVEVVHDTTATVKSHVKALIIDGEITVLGSANADRASWYTSQEVNVAVFAREFAGVVRRALVRGLGGRLERVAGVAMLGEEVVGANAEGDVVEV